MRILAVDNGSVRVGLAISDPGEMIATPVGVIPREGAPKMIAKRAAELGVELVVVGLPLHMNGSEGESAREARALAASLERLGLVVELLDERRTSASAQRALIDAGVSRGKRRESLDAFAAAMLLEVYLARRRNQAADPDAG